MKEKLFNVDLHDNWHGVGSNRKGRFVAADMEQRYKDKEAEKQKARKAEIEARRKANKEKKEKAAIERGVKALRIMQKARSLSFPTKGKQRAYYVPKLGKLKPVKKEKGLWVAKMNILSNWIYFGSALSYNEALTVLEVKTQLRDKLFSKIKMRRGEAYRQETFELFEKYLKFGCEKSYNKILKLYGI